MIVDHVLKIDIGELSGSEWDRLFGILRYEDKEGVIHEPWNLIPAKHRVTLPRGAWAYLPDHIEYDDRRSEPKTKALRFARELDAELEDGRKFEGQAEALEAMIREEQGLIIAQPGFGKTNVALAFAARAKTTVLVLVHTHDILEQWIENIKEAVPDAAIGKIQGKTMKIGNITVATVQTMSRLIPSFETKQEALDFMAQFGAVILDEAHHGPALSFATILNQCPARWRFGFTASKTRADKREPEMRALIGPMIYQSKFKSKVPLRVQAVQTDFRYKMRGQWDYRTLLDRLIADPERNQKIADGIIADMLHDNSCLVLSREISHLENLKALVDARLPGESELLIGTRSKADRKELLSQFRAGTLKCVFATQLADEALDVPILSRVHLTFPAQHGDKIIQQIGRALREHVEKADAVIYDYMDERTPVLRRQGMKRRRAYRANGIQVKGGK